MILDGLDFCSIPELEAFSSESQWLVPTLNLEGRRGRPLHGTTTNAEGVGLEGVKLTEGGAVVHERLAN